MQEDAVAKLKSAVLTNMDFRRQVLANPSQALQSIGIQPTDDLLGVIEKLKQDLEELGAILGITDIEFFT